MASDDVHSQPEDIKTNDVYSQLADIKTKILKYHPGDDMRLVERAFFFAKNAHNGQKRKSGSPYFTHPRGVAIILANLMLDGTTIAAGLLHDCVEDVEDVTIETISEQFGAEVAQLVDGVTKLNKLDFTSREECQAESIRKMFLAMAKDIRVVLIKLADRLHNMRTLTAQNDARKMAIAQETLDIYAPLAHRLGIFSIKWELEDLSLYYLDHSAYEDLKKKIGHTRQVRENSIQEVISILRDKLADAGIKANIEGRPKHFYSIYKKMYKQNKTFEQIYDLIAIRVIVNTVPECYTVLGVVHTVWMQMPNRFKDYISVPKPNMYQALHTTVVGLEGLTFEVQIKTWEMNNVAEFGIAAHWRYKEGRQADDELDRKLYWLRQILDWQNDLKDSNEFMDSLKVDLFADEVFVFTPKGDIVNMPKGATPIDYAYRIHSEIGNKCVGAKVNGRIVPLETELQTGDFVEVLTSQSSHGPKMDWLKIVKTSEAKTKIRSFFKREFKAENIVKGREMLEKEAKRLGYAMSQLIRADNHNQEAIKSRYGLNSIDDFYAAIGFGGISLNQVMTRFAEEQKRIQQKELKATMKPEDLVDEKATKQHREDIAKHASNGIYVKGEQGLLVRFAKCCTPLPGDDIIGYITRGRGVSVHRADCINMKDVPTTEPERLVEVSWTGDEKGSFEGEIHIIAYDRPGLMVDLTTLFSQIDVPMTAFSARRSKDNFTAVINLTLATQSALQLDTIIRQLRKRADIIEVYRANA